MCCDVLRCAAVCCGVLQCAATCSVLRCVAVYCRVLQCAAVRCGVLQCVAVCRSVLQCVAVCRSVLYLVAVCCSALHCIAVRCSVLQCAAVCCSVLQCVAVSSLVCRILVVHKQIILKHYCTLFLRRRRGERDTTLTNTYHERETEPKRERVTEREDSARSVFWPHTEAGARSGYGVATISRLLKIIGLAIKRLHTRSAAVRHCRDFGLKRLRTRSCHE